MRARLDPLQLALAAGLAGVGLATLYAAAPVQFHRQLGWVAAGSVLFALAAFVDYRRLPLLMAPLYLGCLGLLALVRFHGQSALGARRWISVAGFPLEPSELAKVVLVVLLAFVLSRRRSRPSLLETGLALLLTLPVVALLLLQPDLGTAVVFLSVLAVMLVLAGVHQLLLGSLLAGAACSLPLVAAHLHGYQRARLAIFLDPARDPLGSGYNLLQAKIAIGSGGLFGRGWLAEGQGRLGFLPERATDFVFATYTEQFGLVGSLLLLLALAALIYRLLRTASLAPDRFGYLLAGGCATLLSVQALENIGMNVGLTPVAGIPLPLISYGGSSLIATLLALGIVQSVHRRRELWTQPSHVDHALAEAA